MRVVLDANVLVSALLSRTGAPARLVEHWIGGAFDLVVSETLLGEVEGTLRSPRMPARLRAEDAEAFVRLLRDHALLAPDAADPPPIRSRDPDDDYLLALATSEQAVLVSGDVHLLELADRGPVSSPAQFLARIEA